MKRKLCFLLLLCPIFTVVAQDQKPDTKVKVIGEKGIRIGQAIPNVLITGISGLILNGQQVNQAHLSDFRGKLLILDFWATWCAPCRAKVPEIDSLQRVFTGQVVFLPVTYEKPAIVSPVLAVMQQIKPFHLPGVTADTVLHRLFPHRSLPHYVWIDGAGIVRAITESAEVNGPNIRDMLGQGSTRLAEKMDLKVAYDPEQPLLVGGNGGDGSSLTYHSTLSGFIPGLGGGYRISAYDPVKGQTFTVRNAPFTWLCRLAFSGDGLWYNNSSIRLLSKDSLSMNSKLSGQAYEAWLAQGNGYNYELVLPPLLSENSSSFLKQDLLRLFPQYSVTSEPQRTRCLALVRTSHADRIKSSGGKVEVNITPFSCRMQNAPLTQLMLRLKMQYLQNSSLPIVDETGYTSPVDLNLKGKLYDVASLNEMLKPYDLAIQERLSTVPMLVVRDSKGQDSPKAATKTQTLPTP